MLVSMRTLPLVTSFCVALLSALLGLANLSAQNTSPDSNTIPVIDGGVGPCSADFTITDDAAKPVYAATIKVHIAYGFMYMRKLDLQVGTNVAGKARFTGLPDRTKEGLFFRASQGGREGSAFDDTAKTCNAQFTIQLQRRPQ